MLWIEREDEGQTLGEAPKEPKMLGILGIADQSRGRTSGPLGQAPKQPFSSNNPRHLIESVIYFSSYLNRLPITSYPAP